MLEVSFGPSIALKFGKPKGELGFLLKLTVLDFWRTFLKFCNLVALSFLLFVFDNGILSVKSGLFWGNRFEEEFVFDGEGGFDDEGGGGGGFEEGGGFLDGGVGGLDDGGGFWGEEFFGGGGGGREDGGGFLEDEDFDGGGGGQVEGGGFFGDDEFDGGGGGGHDDGGGFFGDDGFEDGGGGGHEDGGGNLLLEFSVLVWGNNGESFDDEKSSCCWFELSSSRFWFRGEEGVGSDWEIGNRRVFDLTKWWKTAFFVGVFSLFEESVSSSVLCNFDFLLFSLCFFDFFSCFFNFSSSSFSSLFNWLDCESESIALSLSIREQKIGKDWKDKSGCGYCGISKQLAIEEMCSLIGWQ